MASLIELRGIGMEVASPVPTRILRSIDVDVEQRSLVAVAGPSGAGKTTLASIIGALQPPSEGSYRFAGTEMVGRSRTALAAFRAERIGFVFQGSHLIDERTALANVELGITDLAPSRADRERRSREALERVGLDAVVHRRAAHLSGGERHRVAVARALVKSPAVVIADEPTAALDQRTGQAILDLLAASTGFGTTVIVVTHDPRAAAMADAVVTIVDGRMA